MTTWRIPLSAHVCTTDDAPAVERADIYLELAVEKQNNAPVLLAKCKTLKSSAYREALWDGYFALLEVRDEYMGIVISRGALLHFDCPRATALAEITQELRKKNRWSHAPC